MPFKRWEHFCSKSGKTISIQQQVCKDCGKTGEYAGLQISVVAHMCNFNRATGLPALRSPNVLLPQGVSFYVKCPACRHGIREWDEGNRWVPCLACEETGYIIIVSQKRFNDIQRQVWESWDQEQYRKADPATRATMLAERKPRKFKQIYKRDHYGNEPERKPEFYYTLTDWVIMNEVDGGIQ